MEKEVVRNKLPIITRETRLLVIEEFKESKTEKDYVRCFIDRVKHENVEAAFFMSQYARKSRDALSHLAGMAFLYRLLEAQAGVDAIKKIVATPPQPRD